MFRCIKVNCFLLVSIILVTANANAEKTHPISSQKVAPAIYMISGKGGNIGVSIGKDGTFMIDDKFAANTKEIIKEIKTIGGNTPSFIINTHWHGDHTGGNQNFGEQGAIIVAHNNVRKRLSQDNYIAAFKMKTAAYSPAALPVITFTKDINFHLNNNTIEVSHLPRAHTDGDSYVYFKEKNVLHTGDLFFNGFYPFIDVDHGGSLKGTLDAINLLLSVTNDQTRIIPGHGPLANKADLTNYRDMLAYAYETLSQLKAKKLSIEQVIAQKPLEKLDKNWSNGIFKTDKWVEYVYAGLE